MTFLRPASIYIHIPFCARRCLYCDFLSTTFGPDVQKRYFQKLQEEIRLRAEEYSGLYHIVSIFFGGGTPSLPSPELITDTLDLVRKSFEVDPDAEITIECNPGTLNTGKLRAYKEAGINRLSIGLQSADDGMLKKLGRIHTYVTFVEEFEDARSIGFDNISVDLMYDLPGQDRAMFQSTLLALLRLKNPPQHISPYSLIVEEGTPFWDRYHEDAERKKLGGTPLFLPSEEEECGMLADLKEILTAHGYHRYEISNWAQEGFESLHNKGYWERREYLGFGPGAASQAEENRYKDTESLDGYLNGDFEKKEKVTLSLDEQIEETMFLGLREMKGINKEAFRNKFGRPLEEIYGNVLQNLTQLGLIEESGPSVRLTERGIEISNLVLAEFLLS